MAGSRGRPSEADRTEALGRLLDGLAQIQDAHDLVASIWDLHPRHDTFPGEVFMELAVNVLSALPPGAEPFDYTELIREHLPECEFRGRDNQKIQFAMLSAAAFRGGVAADVLEVTSWWGQGDNPYWMYSLYAAVAIIRACASRRGIPTGDFARELRSGLAEGTASRR